MRRLAHQGVRLVRPVAWKLGTRAHYLWRDEDSAGIELLSGALSLGFALILLWPQHITLTPRPPLFWGVVAAVAGVMEMIGVFWEIRWCRMIGLMFGSGFWATFAVVYGLTAPTPNWVVYAILALAQIWSLRRVVSP